MIAEPQIARDSRRPAPTCAAAADQMIDAANEAGGRDNITVILFRVGESETARCRAGSSRRR